MIVSLWIYVSVLAHNRHAFLSSEITASPSQVLSNRDYAHLPHLPVGVYQLGQVYTLTTGIVGPLLCIADFARLLCDQLESVGFHRGHLEAQVSCT